MRLLLTSGGLTNSSLKRAFCELIPRPVEKARVAFIPTAANIYSDVSWLKADVENLKSTNVGAVEMVDISKLKIGEVLSACRRADVLWFNGGNTYYLLQWVRNSGLAEELIELLREKLYVGVSAGSMIAGPSIASNTPIFPEEDSHKIDDLTGLKLVPFAVIPHLFSRTFPKSNPNHIEEFASKVSYPVYALDDASAIEVREGKAKLVSEGQVCSYHGELER